MVQGKNFGEKIFLKQTNHHGADQKNEFLKEVITLGLVITNFLQNPNSVKIPDIRHWNKPVVSPDIQFVILLHFQQSTLRKSRGT